MSVLAPSPWPGTPGGAMSSRWGGNIRLYVWAAIAAGTKFKWGPDPADRLNAGNVYGGSLVGPTPPTGTLWVDLTCDVLDVDVHLGGSSSEGPLIGAGSGTASFRLIDPTRKYDPTNPNSPFTIGGSSRLGAGAPIKIWAEVWNGSTIETFYLHTGTVDSWSEEWEAQPGNRRAQVVSSDDVKLLVGLDWGEQPSVGAGDTTTARINRILTYYGWSGPTNLDSSTITEQATTLAQSAWELLTRVAQDEIGFVFFSPDGKLQFRSRVNWTTGGAPALVVGCESPGWDIAMDADVESAGHYFRNAVNASMTGGTIQRAVADQSIVLYRERGLKRTDLGLQTNALAAQWAQFLVSLVGWPRARISSVTLWPSRDPASWYDVLNLKLVQDRVRVIWKPPDANAPIVGTGQVFAIDHRITRTTWEVDLTLALADIYSRVLHWGVHANDRLDRDYVYTVSGG